MNRGGRAGDAPHSRAARVHSFLRVFVDVPRRELFLARVADNADGLTGVIACRYSEDTRIRGRTVIAVSITGAASSETIRSGDAPA